MAGDFNWYPKDDEDSDIVIKQVDAVAVYTNPHGDLAIRQHNAVDDDAIIVIPKSQAQALIDAIKREAAG
jgi:hypothetical protein